MHYCTLDYLPRLARKESNAPKLKKGLTALIYISTVNAFKNPIFTTLHRSIYRSHLMYTTLKIISESSQGILKSINVRVAKKVTKRSSVLLLCLVTIFATQTLHIEKNNISNQTVLGTIFF